MSDFIKLDLNADPSEVKAPRPAVKAQNGAFISNGNGLERVGYSRGRTLTDPFEAAAKTLQRRRNYFYAHQNKADSDFQKRKKASLDLDDFVFNRAARNKGK